MKCSIVLIAMIASIVGVFIAPAHVQARWIRADDDYRRIEIVHACRDGIDFSLGLTKLSDDYPRPELTMAARTTGSGTLVIPQQVFRLERQSSTIQTIDRTEVLDYSKSFHVFWSQTLAAGARVYFIDYSDNTTDIVEDLGDPIGGGRAILAEIQNCFINNMPPEVYNTTVIYDTDFTIGEPPISMPRVAYIYASDIETRNDYLNMLTQHGFMVDPLSLIQAASANFSPYNVILISPDTASNNGWGTALALQNIIRFNKPTVALGLGGFQFLAALGSGITLAGVTDAYQSNRISNLSERFRSTPYFVNYDDGGFQNWTVTLYSDQLSTVLPYKSTSQKKIFPANVQNITNGYVLGNTDMVGFPILYEQTSVCHTFWGFQNSPALMTIAGQNLFSNILYYGGCSQLHTRSVTRMPLTISENITVADINLYFQLYLNKDVLSNLTIQLTAPSGRTATLVDHVQTGNTFGGTLMFGQSDPDTDADTTEAMLRLDDDSGQTFSSLPPPYNRSGVQPNAGHLAAFHGEKARGTWWLTIVSSNPQGEGRLERWGLDVSTYRIYIPATRR